MGISFLKTTLASSNVARLRIRWETVQVRVLSSAPNGNRRSLLPGKEVRRPFFFPVKAKYGSEFQALPDGDAHGEGEISLQMRDGLSKGRRLFYYLCRCELCGKGLISSGISCPIVPIPADAGKIISRAPDLRPQPPEKRP